MACLRKDKAATGEMVTKSESALEDESVMMLIMRETCLARGGCLFAKDSSSRRLDGVSLSLCPLSFFYWKCTMYCIPLVFENDVLPRFFRGPLGQDDFIMKRFSCFCKALSP